ncbi:MAG TPA: aminotransferase class I/II-fold pyridoxal phosphate-dependent enzyme [Polyangiaceae bacterium]|nr:aminotransferase class I/II-fold pyridoxal phosphate-dependent enzyme [Polyangiaceae bacterium]
MSSKPRTFANSTEIVHAGAPAIRSHHALTRGVTQTATYTFENSETLERYMRGEDPDPEREEYGRYGNPTVRELEVRVAKLECAEDGAAFSSGMAAITTAILALVKTGDHVVLFRDCYRRTRQFVTQILPRFGVEHSVVPSGDLAALSAALKSNTRLVLTEAPTNPFQYCVDLVELAKIVRAKGRIRTLIDSTLATPYNMRPLELGIDLVMHSATKYLSGHNDVLGGVVAGPSHIVSLVRDARNVLGAVLDPHAAFLILRGLKTLALRVERQNTTALAVARALSKHPKVTRVYYSGLESHPSYEVARSLMRGGGGMVSFVVEGGRHAASRVVDRCALAKIAASFGGAETLIDQPAIMSYHELSEEELRRIEMDPALIRLSVGIEETDDVLHSVLAALEE